MTGGNPWLERRVLNWAHQGGAREAPSTTLHAMRAAVAAGAHALELDVHRTADGVLVCCHDTTVDRTTDGTGAIASLTLDELRRLDNAYYWTPGEVVNHEAEEAEYVHRGKAPVDAEFAIPTLDEVLEVFPSVFLNLDIKQTAPEAVPYEAELAAALRRHGRGDDVIVASFHDRATDAFAAVAPEFATSYGTSATAEFVFAVRDERVPAPTRHCALQVPHRFGGRPLVDERFVAVAHDLGIAVHVWTVDDDAEMRELVDLGVDGIMTDRPSVLAQLLGRSGLAFGR